MSERTICCVYTRPRPGRAAEYHEWYDRQHLRDVVRVPGVVSAQRFEGFETDSAAEPAAQCLAIYEIEGNPREFVRELRSRFGTDAMPASDALDLESISIVFWKPRGARLGRGQRPGQHSELTDPQLSRLRDALARLGDGRTFSATEALSAALSAGIENHLADIDSALSDLEDAGVIREVQKNPPRWQVVEPQ